MTTTATLLTELINWHMEGGTCGFRRLNDNALTFTVSWLDSRGMANSIGVYVSDDEHDLREAMLVLIRGARAEAMNRDPLHHNQRIGEAAHVRNSDVELAARALLTWGLEPQMRKMQEEACELSVRINHWVGLDRPGAAEQVAAEAADCEQVLRQVAFALGDEAMEVARVNARLRLESAIDTEHAKREARNQPDDETDAERRARHREENAL